MAPSNTLPIHGNEKTMNLNNMILTNIQSSPYFKVNLFELKTYHEVVDEIYYKVGTTWVVAILYMQSHYGTINLNFGLLSRIRPL